MTGIKTTKCKKKTQVRSSSLSWHLKKRRFFFTTGHNINWHATDKKEMDNLDSLYTGVKLKTNALFDNNIDPIRGKKVPIKGKHIKWLTPHRYIVNWKGNTLKNTDMLSSITKKTMIKCVIKSWNRSKKKLKIANKRNNVCDWFTKITPNIFYFNALQK